jgi:hypothetical protein
MGDGHTQMNWLIIPLSSTAKSICLEFVPIIGFLGMLSSHFINLDGWPLEEEVMVSTIE